MTTENTRRQNRMREEEESVCENEEERRIRQSFFHQCRGVDIGGRHGSIALGNNIDDGNNDENNTKNNSNKNKYDDPERDSMIHKETTPLLSDGSALIPPQSRRKTTKVSKNGRQSARSTDSSRIQRDDSTMSSTASTSSLRFLSHRLIKSLSSSQREYALQEMGVGPAAFLIKDAVIGRLDAPYEGWYDPYEDPAKEVRNFLSLLCGRITAYQITNRVILAASWILFCLSFVEPPQWCRDSTLIVAQDNTSDSLREYGDCKVILGAVGTAVDGAAGVELYPNSNAMWLSVIQSQRVEIVCLSVVASFIALEFGRDGLSFYYFLYPGNKRWLHVVRVAMILCLSIGLGIGNTSFNPICRMILLGSFLRNFQAELLSVIIMLPQVIYILAVLALLTFFYGWFGVVLFYGTPQGAAGFQNIIEGVWTLYIMITTANYPDVMMPSYNSNRLSALYFVSFMIISFFYLNNLILATVVNAYDDNIERRKKYRRELSYDLLTKAFKEMDPGNTGRISRDAIMALFVILNEDYPEIRTLNEDETKIIFGFLDKDGSSTITLEEFLGFGNVLLLEFTRESEYATMMEVYFPKIYTGPVWQCVCKLVQSIAFEYCVDLLLVLNAVVIGVQSYPELAGEDVSLDPHYSDGYIDTKWELIESAFTFVYVLEVILKVMVNGWKKYSESARNMFDFSVTLLAVLATAYVYYPNAYNDSRLVRFVVMARVLRLTRLLMAFEAFQLVGTISVDIIPAAQYVLLNLLFLMYAFASLGTALYGGMITRDPNNPLSTILLGASGFVDNEYWANNFNDMVSGMNVLFNLLVVNNWTECEIGYEYVTGGKWVRFFFFAFHVVGVVVINNVVIAFIINAFFQQLKTLYGRRGWEEQVPGEAQIKGDRGTFDASNITGTATGASGTYIARVRPRHMDVEVDERAALRHLFTRTSSSNVD